ncbi:hypothetical protein DVH05_000481 [Phytophthora capsici]|nr:hypothetical protein DVH05_000481 [Phytophthora capsici]
MCILLGYSHNTKGVKILSLPNGGVRTSRLKNIFCHENGRNYVARVLTRDVPEDNGDAAIPIVAIKSIIDSYADDDEVVRRVVAGLPLEGNDGYLADISLEVEKGAIPQLDSGE